MEKLILDNGKIMLNLEQEFTMIDSTNGYMMVNGKMTVKMGKELKNT
jgi:hypothetical protein